MFHFIFDYNYRYVNFWQILIIFLPLETGPNLYKLFHFNLTTKNSQPFNAVLSVEPIVPDFCRKSFNIRFFPCLLENFFGRLLIENLLHSHRFYQNCIFKLNMDNFNMLTTVKLSWLVTYHSYDLIKLLSK